MRHLDALLYYNCKVFRSFSIHVILRLLAKYPASNERKLVHFEIESPTIIQVDFLTIFQNV